MSAPKNLGILMAIGLIIACSPSAKIADNVDLSKWFNREEIIKRADQYLNQEPVPITNFRAERSAGGVQDFYSEGDYWWPNPEDPDGPYVRRDGQTNPENFTAHRLAMRDLSRWVAALAAAYKISGEEKYAVQALKHLHAWFVHPDTRMNPSLLYAQAIKGRVTGRGIGIIDTIHLIEVVQSIIALRQTNALKGEDLKKITEWFDEYVSWLTTHQYGLDEKDHGNNHSTWWAAQVAAFAALADRQEILADCRAQFKKLLEAQMDSLGGFPDELRRTKPFNYSLFNVEGYAVLANIASTDRDNLWYYETSNGTLRKAIDFLLPAIDDKQTWTFPPDVQHFDELPIKTATLIFAAKAYGSVEYLKIWEKLPSERKSKEIDRNFPLRELSLWFE